MADFFAGGPVDFYIKQRGSGLFYYLGTALTTPVVDIRRRHRDLTCDRSGESPWQKLNTSETHIVTVTFNRVEYSTLNRIRTAQPTESAYTPSTGKLSLNVKDFVLFYQWAWYADNQYTAPTSAPIGRLYYSAYPQVFRESEPQRALETTVAFECNPLWYNSERKFKFFTEDKTSSDWPNSLPTPT